MDIVPSAENEAQLRAALHELMQTLIAQPQRKHDPKLQSMLLACRLRLRALQNLLAANATEQSFTLWHCDLRGMVEDICAAADLMLNPQGRTVRFEAPPERIEAACAPREFSWLILELICNAARHTPGEEITVSLQPKRRRMQRKTACCMLTVESAGELDLARLHSAITRKASGTAAALRTTYLHRGALLWLARDGNAVAGLKIPLQMPVDLMEWEPADLVELLSDQCSPVYVALGQVCGI